jgi:hypothetical protein
LALARLATAVVLLGAAAPLQQTAQAGRVVGEIIEAETGRQVRDVKLVLTAEGSPREAFSDAGGRFAFDNLAPGAYTLTASKPGFLTTTYGQSRPGTNTPGRPIHVAAGVQQDARIQLSRGGSISGIVRDPHGDPAYGAEITVFRWTLDDDGPRLKTVATTQSDERGMYRVALLPSREYVLHAAPHDPRDEAVRARAPTSGAFYPSVPSPFDSPRITLIGSETRAGVDIQLPFGRPGRVRGVLVDAAGRPQPDVPVSIISAFRDTSGQGTTTDAGGRFTFDDLAPGLHELTGGGSVLRFEGGTVMVSEDGNSVSVATSRLSASSADREAIRVLIDGALSKGGSGRARSEVNVRDGETVDVVLVLQAPRKESAPVRPNPPQDTGTIEGAIINTLSRPSGPHSVVLIPVDEQAWGAGGESIRKAIANDDGLYAFRELRSGSYRICVTHALEPDEWLDRDTVRRLVASSVPVTIAAGERRRQDLRVQ